MLHTGGVNIASNDLCLARLDGMRVQKMHGLEPEPARDVGSAADTATPSITSLTLSTHLSAELRLLLYTGTIVKASNSS